MNSAATLHLDKTYSLTLGGDTLHNILNALGDAERSYRRAGFTGMAENAVNAYQMILKQITEAK
jgi:hypothetical protein